MSGSNIRYVHIDVYGGDELIAKYDEFMALLKKVTTPSRYETLEWMYSEDELGPNLVTSPASSRPYFHNAYRGGYMDHVMNVVKASMKVMKLFESMGGVINFTKEELVFAAFHHDLGKLGTPEHPYYIRQDSDWHVKERKEYFKANPELEFMSITDRSLHTLQRYGIKLTDNEYMAIRLADGMYEDPNKTYFVKFEEDRQLRRNIVDVLHWADHMATKVERQSDFVS